MKATDFYRKDWEKQKEKFKLIHYCNYSKFKVTLFNKEEWKLNKKKNLHP